MDGKDRKFTRTVPSRNYRHSEEVEWTEKIGSSPEQCLTEITKNDVQEKLKKIS